MPEKIFKNFSVSAVSGQPALAPAVMLHLAVTLALAYLAQAEVKLLDVLV